MKAAEGLIYYWVPYGYLLTPVIQDDTYADVNDTWKHVAPEGGSKRFYEVLIEVCKKLLFPTDVQDIIDDAALDPIGDPFVFELAADDLSLELLELADQSF